MDSKLYWEEDGCLVEMGGEMKLEMDGALLNEPEEIVGGAKHRAFERPSRLARTVPKLDFNR
jgi:hypothetical protein